MPSVLLYNNAGAVKPATIHERTSLVFGAVTQLNSWMQSDHVTFCTSTFALVQDTWAMLRVYLNGLRELTGAPSLALM